ncbi:MAG: fatty acid desaturase [Leptospiraceae bacterium]|nr:fatty acid desaturase [Leptospiraceae bacterium]
MNNSIQTSLSLNELKNTIPSNLFKPSDGKSIYYFIKDIIIILSLLALAYFINSWYFYPIYWLVQGTYFWALFVIGHDCGHGSFSSSKKINNLFGHLSHAPILVPFHGWRISHRKHHNNTGNIEKDESWFPIHEHEYNELNWASKLIRYQLFLFVFPLYLLVRSPKRDGSHFFPSSDLFQESERNEVLISSFSVLIVLICLVLFAYFFGFNLLFKLYIAPYVIFTVWISLVTLLHHTDIDIPWYNNHSWEYLKGALSSRDRSYGFIENIHHNIGTHVIHHIFPKIPHYNLIEANQYLMKSIEVPTSKEPVWKTLLRVYRSCKFIPDEGNIFYYKSPKSLN